MQPRRHIPARSTAGQNPGRALRLEFGRYTAGEFDGVSATNMDTLSIPAGSGVDTTALIVGDFSNGNDAVILKGEGTLED